MNRELSRSRARSGGRAARRTIVAVGRHLAVVRSQPERVDVDLLTARVAPYSGAPPPVSAPRRRMRLAWCDTIALVWAALLTLFLFCRWAAAGDPAAFLAAILSGDRGVNLFAKTVLPAWLLLRVLYCASGRASSRSYRARRLIGVASAAHHGPKRHRAVAGAAAAAITPAPRQLSLLPLNLFPVSRAKLSEDCCRHSGVFGNLKLAAVTFEEENPKRSIGAKSL